ncbi:alpha amylase family protein [Evansella sp. AB-rgal1]|uniref:alpha amylase family protein n=1 Tax=Evansella sp. AB-rgal1 TaxID=3242696 RepID=UPI00359DD224
MKSDLTYSSNVCLWMDFMANWKNLLCEKKQHRIFQMAKDRGVNEIVIDGKIPYGYTTFPSKWSPHVSSFPNGAYVDWKGRDLVKELVRKGKKYGFFTWVKLDVFTEGHKDYRDHNWEKRRACEVTYLDSFSGGSSFEGEEGNTKTLFVNPANREVQEYELHVIKEVAQYEPDGIVLDRARYPNRYADFSQDTREMFAKFLGRTECVQTEEILFYDGSLQRWVEGPLYAPWICFRAGGIKKFILKVKGNLKEMNSPKLALYSGAWYESSHEEGLNWASKTHNVKEIPPVTGEEVYRSTSLADIVDRLFIGSYYPQIHRIEETEGMPLVVNTVEDSIKRAQELVNGACELYGGLYLLHYNEPKLSEAMEMIDRHSDGVMLFDLVYFKG